MANFIEAQTCAQDGTLRRHSMLNMDVVHSVAPGAPGFTWVMYDPENYVIIAEDYADFRKRLAQLTRVSTIYVK